MTDYTSDIRKQFADLRLYDPNAKMLDIIGASFLVTDDTIFGEPNQDYIRREIAWYESQSLNVNDIPGGPPKIWQQVADDAGVINSNYGWLLHSPSNGNQFEHVLNKLRHDPDTRQAVAIYTNPAMHWQAKMFGRSDFVCTNAVHYRIKRDHLTAIVQMRSNDAIFGFRNDYAWQLYVQRHMAEELGVGLGNMHWQAASLHIYPRHFKLVDEYIESGEYRIQV